MGLYRGGGGRSARECHSVPPRLEGRIGERLAGRAAGAAAGGGDGGWRRLKRSERTPPLIAPAGIFLFCLQVLGLEAQPSAPHSQGSSHGLSRIIRLAYFEHPSYVPLLRESYRMWRDLEAQSGEVSVWQTFIEWHGRMAG